MSQQQDRELELRLKTLRESMRLSPRLSARVMNEIGNDSPGNVAPGGDRVQLRRWLVRGIGLAACAAIGTFLWILLISPAQRAYGIEDARKQLGGVNSLHIRGKAGDGQTWEVYVQRPDRCYRVQSGHRIVQTAEKSMVIDDGAKTAVILPGDALDIRFLVEGTLQTEMITQLVGPLGEQFHKIRREQVGEIETDVYESVEPIAQSKDLVRREVFLDPRTALPVKAVVYIKDAGLPEQAVTTLEQIEANGPAPKGAFDFKAPAGYELLPPAAAGQPADGPVGPTSFASANTDHLHFEISYTFDIDSKGILVCWALYDDRNPREDMTLPDPGTFTLAGQKGRFVEHRLRADPMADGHHWRWSLIAPSDPTISMEQNERTMTIKTKHAKFSLDIPNVKFLPAELERFIVEAQRRTLARNQKPLSLDEIRTELQGLRAE